MTSQKYSVSPFASRSPPGVLSVGTPALSWLYFGREDVSRNISSAKAGAVSKRYGKKVRWLEEKMVKRSRWKRAWRDAVMMCVRFREAAFLVASVLSAF